MNHLQYFPTFDETALATQLGQWQSASPGLGVWALVAERDCGQVPRLQALCRDRGVPLVGAVFPALLADAGFAERGVCLIGLDAMPSVFLLEGTGAEGGVSSEALSGALSAMGAYQPGPDARTVFLIFDAMQSDIQSLLVKTSLTGPSPLQFAGACAGSETFQPIPCLFDDKRFIQSGVLGLLLAGTDVPVKHGYPVARTLMRATSTTGNRIATIDGHSAFDAYRNVVQQEFGLELTAQNFYEHAVHFPLAVVNVTDITVRIPVRLAEDGAIYCIGEVPPNSMLRVIRAPAPGARACVSELAHAMQGRNRLVDEALVTFYCAGRRMHFGADVATQELDALARATSAAAQAGALSLGEIGTSADEHLPIFHNAALVCL